MNVTTLTHAIRRYALLSLLYLSGPIFLITTNPSHLPLVLLVVPFMWLFAVLFVTTWLLLKRRVSVTRKQAALVSGVMATIPVLLAIFQSIHQLSLRDVLLSTGLVFLAAVYMLRADFIR